MDDTFNPPLPTPEEESTYFFGVISGRTQHARKHRTTGALEVWWTGGQGHWGSTKKR